jgi:hypothetical protein
MIDTILRDASEYPRCFFWFGPLQAAEIEHWEKHQAISIPPDLKELWALKGGVDIFESETILQPFGAEEYDLIEPVSSVRWGRGLDPDYFVFQIGSVNSVFRKSDGGIFAGSSEDLAGMTSFRDLDDWYVNTIRSDFAERYGLKPL